MTIVFHYSTAALLKCQEQRLQHLRKQCVKHNLVSNLSDLDADEFRRVTFWHLVDERHRVILKTIPKSGCSSWKYILITNAINEVRQNIDTEYLEHITDNYNLSTLSYFKREDVMYKLSNYFTILTIRHPLARLESAYRDKIVDFHKSTHTVNKFKTFLDNIISHRDGHDLDVHYRPVTWHTNPCAVPFE